MSDAIKPLDPTWWCRSGTGYTQQDGKGRLVRLKERTKVTGWSLYVCGEWRGQWRLLRSAKRRAFELTGGT